MSNTTNTKTNREIIDSIDTELRFTSWGNGTWSSDTWSIQRIVYTNGRSEYQVFDTESEFSRTYDTIDEAKQARRDYKLSLMALEPEFDIDLYDNIAKSVENVNTVEKSLSELTSGFGAGYGRLANKYVNFALTTETDELNDHLTAQLDEAIKVLSQAQATLAEALSQAVNARLAVGK